MIKAVLKNGTIQPLESLPADWTEGRELLVEEAPLRNGTSPANPDDSFNPTNPDDDLRLQEALAEVRQQTKAFAGHEKMGG
jgi:hypothetical protein